jgi:hypothetical protein
MSAAAVVIEEIQGRSLQGVTRPFICVGDDGDTYYVKGAGAGRRSLICEWVSAHLATAFGLPVAGYVLAEVPEALLTTRVRADLAELGPGLVFASRRLPNVQELNPITRAMVPPSLALDVLVFDWWLHNEDRHLTEHGGNPNLLWDVAGAELAVIDHNQAFDPDFEAARFLETHVFSDEWNFVYGDHDLRAAYEQRMKKALTGLAGLRASIPDSWWWAADDVPANVSWDDISHCLARCDRPDFWNLP